MIEAKKITSGYSREAFLDIDSLSFEKGRITTVLGLNGSGKSTLLKTLTGIIPHTGEILIDGKELSALSRKEIARRVAFLPQNLPSPNMCVQTLVEHGRFASLSVGKVLRQKDRELVKEALMVTDIYHKRDANLNELSGGEKQRAFLAMTVAQDTAYLLLDEPCSYMDIHHQQKLVQVLKYLAENGRGIIMTSHDLPQSFSVSNSIVLIKEGRLAACGTPDFLLEQNNLIQNTMNVSLAKLEQPNLLYKYAVTKGGNA